MEQSKWHMHKIGLVDFWCYENEVFNFQNGHMLLRGSNGSGKSVTMQSILPLLLDGNRSSERIDSFGTRSRKMDTYLIDENSDRDDRIGYLYLECKREDVELYLTIGMGLHARKNKPLDVWYFVIENNIRVNIDFQLIENGLTLSKKQLINVLGNQVISSQKDYMKKVNDLLFGFDTEDEYKEFLDLLLKLRAPKLSNSLTPMKIAELLSTSLPPLSDEDLRPMSEAVNSMDNLQDELESLEICLNAANKIENSYRKYNEAILLQKYQRYLDQVTNFKKSKNELKEIQESVQKQLETLGLIENQIRENENEKDILENEKLTLADSDLDNKHQQLLNYKEELENVGLTHSIKKDNLDKKDESRIDLEKNIQNYKGSMEIKERNKKELFLDLEELYDGYPISEYIVLKKNVDNYKFSDIYTVLKQDKEKTYFLKSEFERYESILDRVKALQEQYVKLQDEETELEKKLSKNEMEYKQVIDYYTESFYKYSSKNKIIRLSKSELQEMMMHLTKYEETQSYFPINQLVTSSYQRELDKILQIINHIRFELDKEQVYYDELDQEYQKWLEKKEFEPVRDDYVLKSRESLSQMNIDFKPFYQCIRFSDSLSSKEESYIEEVLRQLNILDALIISEKDKSKIADISGHDFYLWTSNSIESLVEQEIGSIYDLNKVFDTLGIRNMESIHFSDYGFDFENMTGKIDGHIPSLLIGQTRREEIRQSKIKELENLIQEQKKRIQHFEKQLVEQEENKKIAKKEISSFITEEMLRKSYQVVKETINEIDFVNKKMNQVIDQKQKENQNANSLLQKVKETAEKLLVKLDKNAINNRLKDIDDFYHKSNELESVLGKIHNYEQLIAMSKNQYESIVLDIDELRYEIEQLEDKKEVLEPTIKLIEEQLKEVHYDQKMERIEKIHVRLKQLDSELINLRDRRSSLNTTILVNQEKLKEKQLIADESMTKKEKYKDIFNQEYKNRLVFVEDDVDENMKKLSTKEYGKKVSEYLTSLQSVFYENVQFLAQYHLHHESQELPYDFEDVDSHLMIYAEYSGRKISFLKLVEVLKSNIDMQKLLIQEEDRNIFEEILVNTIGKKIRERIHTAQRWVAKIEKYMQNMSISSGLQLGIRWKAKESMDDGLLSTKELIKLLEKDYSILKENDLNKISNHFRKRIDRARKLSSEIDESKSFHQLMREVMDYRTWFEFVLYGKKTHEARKELTNKLFYSYSGGEKAIVMYVPLFSAVAAKFEGAKSDAPFIIALDEAFAGVDENNIDNMFDLVEKFGFDYMMTSQALWGDYATCKSLAIYELYRPNNASFVTKLGYVWNGNKKKVIYE